MTAIAKCLIYRRLHNAVRETRIQRALRVEVFIVQSHPHIGQHFGINRTLHQRRQLLGSGVAADQTVIGHDSRGVAPLRRIPSVAVRARVVFNVVAGPAFDAFEMRAAVPLARKRILAVAFLALRGQGAAVNHRVVLGAVAMHLRFLMTVHAVHLGARAAMHVVLGEAARD